MKLAEIIDRQNAIRSELTALEESPETTEEDHADLRDSLIEEYEQLSKRAAPVIERMEKLKLIQRTSNEPGSREGGDGTVTRWDGGGRGPEFMQRADPFADLDRVRDRMVKPSETVSRAVTATENAHRRGLLDSDRAEEATRKIQRNPFIARHCLLTGSDDYVEAFRAYLEDPMGEAQRAGPVSLTLANGGYLLPYVLDPTIVLTNNASANPYRRIAKVIQTTSNAWQGVNSAGVNAQWLNESATAADASPAVGQIQIFPKKAAAWVFGTFEALEDTSFADQLPGMLGDAKDRLEEGAFATGTGVTGSQTGSPRGVLVAISATGTGSRVLSTMGTATGGLIGTAAAADVYNLQAALPPRFRMDNSVGWVANITNINRIRALDQYGGSSFWANLGPDTPEQLLGKPIYESTSITNATGGSTASGSALMVFGAWDNFLIVDRVGTSMLYEPMIRDTTSNTPTGQAGWFYFWRVGSDVTSASAFRWLSNGSG